MSAAADTLVDTFVRSLDGNQLCGVNWEGRGTYTAEGIIKLSDALKVNATLTSLRCATKLTFPLWKVSAAADTLVDLCSQPRRQSALWPQPVRRWHLHGRGHHQAKRCSQGQRDVDVAEVRQLTSLIWKVSAAADTCLARVCSVGGNRLKAEGAKLFAEVLEVNSTLTSVEYVTACPHLPTWAKCQQPLTLPASLCVPLRATCAVSTVILSRSNS